MSWRDRLAAIIASGGRSDLPTQAYHGTKAIFPAFENRPVDEQILSLGLGTHVARDPYLASSLADHWMYPAGKSPSGYKLHGGAPNVLPVAIPAEEKFLQVRQPIMPSLAADEYLPMWQRVAGDDRAVERMMAKEGYSSDPMMLERYLREARGLRPSAAERGSRA